MQITVGKLLAFWFLFSRGKSVFVCWRSLYSFLKKRCFSSIASAVLKRDFQDVHPKTLLPLQYWFVWLQLSEHVDITCLAYYMLRVKGNIWIFLIMRLLSSQDHTGCTGHQELSYIWEITFTFIFTCLFCPYISKIAWPQVCFLLLSTCKVSQKCRDGRKYHRSA